MERHVAECLYCLERWTALREVANWLRETKPLPAGDVAAFLPASPLRKI